MTPIFSLFALETPNGITSKTNNQQILIYSKKYIIAKIQKGS